MKEVSIERILKDISTLEEKVCCIIKDLATVGGVNIYNGDGVVEENRDVDGNNKDILFHNFGEFEISNSPGNLTLSTGQLVVSTGTVTFNEAIPNNPTPLSFLVFDGAGDTGGLNYATVADMQTALGIGAGGVTGANNGLQLSGAIVQLGGTLNQNTTINGAVGAFNLIFTAINSFEVASQTITLGTTTGTLSLSSSTDVSITSSSDTTITSGADIILDSVGKITVVNPIANAAPTHIFTTGSFGNSEVDVSTIAEVQTALGIGAGALTAGYIAYGTGTGITGEAALVWDDLNNRLRIGISTGTGRLNFPDAGVTAADGISFGTGLANLYRYTANQLVTDGSLIIGEKGGFNPASGGLIVRNNGGLGKIEVLRASDNVTGTYVNQYKSRGTQLVPVALNTGDEVGMTQYYAYDGVSYIRTGFFGSTGYNSVTKQANFFITPSNDGSNGYFLLSPNAAITCSVGGLTGALATSALTIAQTWNTSGSPTLIKANVTHAGVGSGASSLLMDLQVGGVSMFKVDKVGNTTIHGSAVWRANNIQSTNFNAPIGISGYTVLNMAPNGLTGALATSILDMTQSWNTSGTPTAIKLNITDIASNAASLLMNLQVGGTSQFKVSKAGLISTKGVALISTGAAATAGTATLVAGTVTVNTTAMTATAILNLTRKTAGGTIGNITYTQVDGTSFTINSDNALDTSVFVWNIIETY